jgi:hypothetical protein
VSASLPKGPVVPSAQLARGRLLSVTVGFLIFDHILM